MALNPMSDPSGDAEQSDYPEARLRPITKEERSRHPWYQQDVPLVAICGAIEGCAGWLAAVQTDSGGTPRQLLIAGTHRNGGMGHWWAKRPPQRSRNWSREEVSWYRSVRMAQVPLSGWPGRVKIQCPECGYFSKIVVSRKPPSMPRPSGRRRPRTYVVGASCLGNPNPDPDLSLNPDVDLLSLDSPSLGIDELLSLDSPDEAVSSCDGGATVDREPGDEPV